LEKVAKPEIQPFSTAAAEQAELVLLADRVAAVTQECLRDQV
jgi:hypothetical protein